MTFPQESVWSQIESQRRSAVPPTREDIDAAIAKVTEDADRKRVAAAVDNLPLDHWHHDLETVDILLEQHPPDIHRARQILGDIRQEIYRGLR